MRLGWKVFLPLSLIWLVLTAGCCWMAFRDWLPNAVRGCCAVMAFLDRTARGLLLGELSPAWR